MRSARRAGPARRTRRGPGADTARSWFSLVAGDLSWNTALLRRERGTVMTNAPAYRALALQARTRSVAAVADPGEARAQIKASIDRIHEQVVASVRFVGPDCRLVVLPEYALTGHPVGD